MIRPLRDFIVVKPLGRVLSSTLIIPISDREKKPNLDGRGVVMAIGPGRRSRKTGIYHTPELKVGDNVFYEEHKTYPKDPTDPALLVMQEADCVAFDGELEGDEAGLRAPVRGVYTSESRLD